MKNLDLNAFGVLEMNAEEMISVEGGIWPLVVIAVVAIVASSCATQKTAVGLPVTQESNDSIK